MAATKPASSTTPSSLNFLKEGLLLPGRNRRLFAAIFTILVAWISLLLVANELGVEPIKLEVGRDMDTLMSTDPRGPDDYAHLLRDTQEDYLVVAVDESEARRCHGAGAVGRSWQLVKGRQERAMLFVSVMSVLASVFRLIYWQAKIYARSNMALEALLLGVLYTIQMAAVELFQDCAMTAFYYECKGRSAQKPETEYVKLSIQDA